MGGDGSAELAAETKEAIETLEYITRSTCRVRILETLAASGSATRDELRDDIDVVRTTMARNLDGLDDRGFLRERDRVYELTAAGALVAEGLFESLRRGTTAIRLAPVLERLSTEDLDVDLDRLHDATVYEATTANPYGPVERHGTRLAETDHARLVLPAAGARAPAMSREGVDEDTVHEVVATPSVVETIESDPAVEREIDEIAETARVAVSVYDGELPYYLGVLDETVQLGVHDENGIPAAMLESTDESVREWALGRFEEYRTRATPVR